MRVYLDTEFNGFGGELISLALVPERENWPSFYAVREVSGSINPWVAEHVMPVLREVPRTPNVFTGLVQDYMMRLPKTVEVIADWPEDISHLCAQLCAEAGQMLRVFPTFCLVDTWGGGGGVSKVPHNALEDARALRLWHQGLV